jgi:hypothetical protein
METPKQYGEGAAPRTGRARMAARPRRRSPAAAHDYPLGPLPEPEPDGSGA